MEKKIVKIPNVAEEVRIGFSFNYLIKVIGETSNFDNVQWDFTDVQFLHPFFLAPLAIYKNTCGENIECVNMSLPIQSYMNSVCFDRMLHFDNDHREDVDAVMERYLDKSFLPDTVITIPGSFKKAGLYQEEIDGSDAEALKLANEGYSTKNRPDAENRGYGISTSKKMLVVGMKGAFFMLSGGAFHRYEDACNDYISLKKLFNWKGTIILLRIPVNLPEDFNYINYLE